MADARRALITGVGGQDGSLLAELLVAHHYEVFGIVRLLPERYTTLEGLRDRLHFVSVDLTDPVGVAEAVRQVQPDEVYHFASVSFVPASWEDPVGTTTFAARSITALLEALRKECPEAHFLNAASAEIFGDPPEEPQSERTPVAPLTPYGAGKALGRFLTDSFRRRYRLHASSAILFNHESPRRPPSFVTRKISRGVAAIRLGLGDELVLGDLEARRDWGYAGDYVRAMRLMLAASEPNDYVIATGEAHTVEDFAALAFERVDLDWRDFVRVDEALVRGAYDARALVGDPTKARERLGWTPTVGFEELVAMMVDSDLALLRASPEALTRSA